MAQTFTEYAEFPNPFVFNDGSMVKSEEDWRQRRSEMSQTILDIQYGNLPPRPSSVKIERLGTYRPKMFSDSEFSQYRIILEKDPSFYFRLDLHAQKSEKPLPVILTGDGCYLNVTHELREEILKRGFALAIFSRIEIVPDVYDSRRNSGLYQVYPNHDFGALAAWAWGYHRAVDALEQLGDSIDASRIAITGHSRGGKTVLLAGATDERIALTAPNASGLGGTGSFLCQAPKCETLERILKSFPHWFGPKLRNYVGREAELPFDQHFLKALVAPRPFFNANGYDDLWVNPAGTWQTHMAAKEVYRFLNVENRIGHWYRPGGHLHGKADWKAFLDFAQWHLQGVEPTRSFNENPYPDMKPVFSWRAPDLNKG